MHRQKRNREHYIKHREQKVYTVNRKGGNKTYAPTPKSRGTEYITQGTKVMQRQTGIRELIIFNKEQYICSHTEQNIARQGTICIPGQQTDPLLLRKNTELYNILKVLLLYNQGKIGILLKRRYCQNEGRAAGEGREKPIFRDR